MSEKTNHSKHLEFSIDWEPTKPKYIQLAEAIAKEIEEGKLKKNDRIPSVNKLSKVAEISRETVFKALGHLSERGIIKAANRQGYYVTRTDIKAPMRIFFLLDKFTTFKEQLYHSFQKTIGNAGEVEIFFHHHNLSVFRSLIIDNLPHYTHFVITTFLRENVDEILNMIPSSKRMILDSYEPNLKGEYSMIFQDFASDIVKSLERAKEKLDKYKRLVLLAPGSLYHADWVIKGLQDFAKKSNFPTAVLASVDASKFRKGDVYIALSAYDQELVQVIKLARNRGYKVGTDIGIISYNDTPVKEVLEGGITVITTDFAHMGEKAAKLLIDRKIDTQSNPTRIIFRNSF